MNTKHLHIVTHDVPWPADYGGVTDLFYKLKSLHKLGININLHCFTQGRAPQEELNKYCSSVTYYKRKNKISRFSFHLPFIVNSRKDEQLIANLLKDDHPVLLEGIHTTFYLAAGKLINRKVAVRLHNTEFRYYQHLAKYEINIFKKLYFLYESRLLKKYEKSLADKALFFTVSRQDKELYQQEFDAKKIHYIPVFLPYILAAGKEGKGCFCLYHGNLAISENDKAARWLLKNIFSNNEIPFVIAGKNPSKKLTKRSHVYPNTCLIANPSDKELNDLIAKAQIHVLPSFNDTGVKIKLLNAIFNGRHCLVNSAAVDGTVLGKYCHLSTDVPSFQNKIIDLYQQPFTDEEIQRRQGLLQIEYNNELNAKKIILLLYE